LLHVFAFSPNFSSKAINCGSPQWSRPKRHDCFVMHPVYQVYPNKSNKPYKPNELNNPNNP
jgi:hypothetical protein